MPSTRRCPTRLYGAARDSAHAALQRALLTIHESNTLTSVTVSVSLLSEQLRASHLEAVVTMQQRHASAIGVIETFSAAPLMDDALRLHTL